MTAEAARRYDRPTPTLEQPVTRIRPRTALAAAALVALGFAGARTLDTDRSAADVPAPKTIGYSRVIDLSHTIDPKIPLWPGDPKVRFKTVASFKKDGYFLRSFTIGEHSATHMNAANSFIAGNRKAITSYPASQRVVRAAVIDVRDKVRRNADYRVTQADIEAWEAAHGRIEPGTFVILYTGWQQRWGNPKAFFNQDRKGRMHFPGFAGATARWLLSERSISGAGTDTHGLDPGLDTAYATNTALARAHKLALECMANLDKLPATGATLILAPLQLRGGSGSPLDVVALVP